MESNLGQQAPKLNVTNVSSAVFGKDGPALGEESKIGKLSRIVRTTRIKVNNVEKIVDKQENTIVNLETVTDLNSQKITRIKKIIQTQKSDIGKKLPGSTEEKEKAKLTTTLEETNRILVEIQKQLAYDFAMRVAEDKQEAEDEKEATSKKKFKREETALEKSAKTVVNTVKSATKKMVSPIGNIFQKLLTFIGILGQGIASNAIFEFFKDEENRKNITKFFNILKENWKLLRNILLTVVAVGLAVKVAAAIGAIGSALSLLASPVGLTILAGLALAAGAGALADHTRKLRKKQELQMMVQVGAKDSTKIGGDDGMTFEEYKIFNYMEPGFEGLQDATVDPRIERNRQRFEEVMSPDFDIMDETPQIIQREKTFGERVGDVFRPVQNFIYGGARAMGGPVKAGSAYLVGERGPELFSPNIDGSIVNNMQTEKIYKMITSGKKGRTRIVELPPQTIEGPKPEIKLPQGPATKAPKISSSNALDGYRSVTSEIYGIMV